MAAPIPLSYQIRMIQGPALAALVAQYPNGILIPPAQAAVQFGAIIGTFPGGITPLYPPGSAVTLPWILIDPQITQAILIPSVLSAHLNDETFTMPTRALTETFYWVGIFLCGGAAPAGPGSGTPAATPILLAARRFLDGFELQEGGEVGTGAGSGGTGQTGAESQHLSRDASRTADGLGLALRAPGPNSPRSHNIPISTNVSWERIYVRPRVLDATELIWWVSNSTSMFAGAGSAELSILPSGAIKGYSNTEALGTTAPLPLNVWSRLDFRIFYKSGATPGNMQMYVNGVLAFNTNAVVGNGLGTSGGTHAASTVGLPGSGTTLELDLDDWINAGELANPPAPLVGPLPGHDLASGSHVSLVSPTGFGPSNTGWTGDYRSLLILALNSGNPPPTPVTSAVSAALLEVTTDYIPAPGQLGLASLAVGAYAVGNSPGGTASVGYVFDGAVTSLSTSIPTNAWRNPLVYTVPDNQDRDKIPTVTTIYLRWLHDATINTHQVGQLFAAAENIGIFGPEDSLVSIPTYSFPGIHNAPWLSTYGGNQALLPPLGTFEVTTGVIAGNNSGQDLLPGQSCTNWLYMRPVVNTNPDGVLWWSSMVGSHNYLVRTPSPWYMPRARPVASAPALALSGSSTNNNATGRTYRWVSVSDGAMRYMLNGAFSHNPAVDPATNALISPNFFPEGGFFFRESDPADALTGAYFKGLGHTSQQASPLDGAQVTSVVGFAAGVLTSRAPLNAQVPQTAFSLWRRSDGSTILPLMDLPTWTGDGTGTRVIPCNLQGGTTQIPCLVIVSPNNDAAYLRDDSDAGTTSHQIGASASTATAITAVGKNQFTVGATLNALGVVYNAFVLAAGVTVGPPPHPPHQPPWLDPPLNPPPGPGGGGCAETFPTGSDAS